MQTDKFKVLLYLKKSGLDKSGQAPIMGRITYGRTIAQFSCKLSCNPKLWNARESRLNGKSREAVATNGKLERLLLSVQSAYRFLCERGIVFTATDIKEQFQGSMQTQITFLERYDRMVEEMEQKVGIEIKATTMSSYHTVRKHLQTFIREKYRTVDIPFGQIEEDFLECLQHYSVGKLGHSQGHYRTMALAVKKVCRLAYREGLTERQLFAHVQIERGENKQPRALDRASLDKLQALTFEPYEVELATARNLFLFSVFTGLAFADLQSLRASQIETNSEGKRYIRKARQKTEVESLIPLHPIAEQILSLYTKEESKRDYKIFPGTMSKGKLLTHIKAVGLACGFRTPLTWHCARHSFGTLTLEAGIPIESIDKMMGHSSIASTQIYAQITDQKIARDMERAMSI